MFELVDILHSVIKILKTASVRVIHFDGCVMFLQPFWNSPEVRTLMP